MTANYENKYELWGCTMYKRNTLFILILFLILTAIPLQSSAESVKGCHCFNNRAFNPAEKFAADDYILATTFNSLLARSFNISKREIVMLKMQGGIQQNDLLIGLHTAKLTGLDMKDVLDLRRQSQSWEDTLLNPQMNEIIKTDKHLQSIQSGKSLIEISSKIANDIIADFYREQVQTIEQLKGKEFNEKEINLIFILGRSSGKKPQDLAEQYTKGEKSWSEIADNLGFEPAQAGKLVMGYPTGKAPD